MFQKLLLFVSGLLITSAASAQEYGFLAGVHQTTATADQTGVSTDGIFGFKLGLTMGFELAPGMRFRTGAIYDQRHFDSKVTISNVEYKTTMKLDYIDVPALFQYNFSEAVGVYGGLNIGININDKTSTSPEPGTAFADPDVNGLIPLAQVGMNFLASDMIGFDVYYERGLGKVAEHYKDFSTFGANFIYWF